MDHNIESLFGDAVVTHKPNPDVIKALEEVLEMARSGEIVGFVGAVLHGDDSTTIRRAGYSTRGLIGTLVIAEHLLILDHVPNGS